MVGFRRAKLLVCFYCGKRTSIPNDGSHSEFLCLKCDAVNYIDENGEIRDPPVATESEAPAPRYAAGSPSSSRSDNVFCDTCLKNQRLFTASLAQYLPDSASDPISEPLDRKYYKFRRALEERYPQVCTDCEGRVQGRLQAAGYTAQTDHLRRSMASSRSRRPRKGWTALDLVLGAGSFFWWAGLVLQLLWHLKVASMALEIASKPEDGLVDPEAGTRGPFARVLVDGARLLPSAAILMEGSITNTFIALWWNPRLTQVARGFSRHLVGLGQWYCFQGLILIMRFVFRHVGSLGENPTITTPSSVIRPHFLMAGLMILISALARSSIRDDTRVLFNMSQGLSPARPRGTAGNLHNLQQEHSSSELGGSQQPSSPSRGPSQRRADLRPLPGPQPPPIPFPASSAPRAAPTHHQPFGAPEPQSPMLDEPEEMDWTPTQSQHRAFSSVPAAGSPSRPFSETPVQAESGPFWYKVPPAPVNPAHKLRNPPRVPIVGNPVAESRSQGLDFSSKTSNQQMGSQGRSTAVEFTPPTFFAPTKDDERGSLADMLNKSFSLAGEPDESGLEPASAPAASSDGYVQHTPLDLHVPVIYTLLLLIWTMPALVSDHQSLSYVKEMHLCVMFVAGVLALSRMGKSGGIASQGSSGLTVLLRWLWPVLEVSELALLCYVGWGTWSGQADVTGLGFGVLVFGVVKNGAVAIGVGNDLGSR